VTVPDPVELLRELIRFDTTNPPGNEEACVAHVESLLHGAGIESQRYEKTPGRPNLVARLRGGDAAPLLLYGHVDVVTTAGQDWTHPPFDGVLEDGWVWGRGALDMKGGVAMLVTAFVRAHAEGAQLPGDVILAVLSDEEGGGDLGARFLVEEHPELFAGVRHALGEFGGATAHVGGRRFYPIQVAEKQICWLRVRVRGRGGHAAMPHRHGTMARLARVLADLDDARLPHHVTPVVRMWIESMSEATPELAGLLDPETSDTVAAGLDGSTGLIFEAALRNTANATIVRGGEKINVIPAEVELEVDGRALPGCTPDDLIGELRTAIGDDVEIDVVRHDPGLAEPDLSLLDTLGDILRELDPEAIPVPMMQIGVTDARFFSRIGIQTYGFLPLNLPEGFDLFSLVHAADERVPADSLRFGAEALFRALERFGA
jgi:acetylornithine deacetylase/succinyl-diaminopimelate desuccinylase-like protein